MNIIKILVGIVAALTLALGVAFVAARFHDGPLGIIPGGPIRSGELVVSQVDDWSSEADVDTIEMQLAGDTTSRTTWFVVHQGKGYIPASLGFPPGKTWHLRADQSQATLRIRGKRFEVQLTKLEDPDVQSALVEIVRDKYAGGPPSDAGVWFFQTESLVPAAPTTP